MYRKILSYDKKVKKYLIHENYKENLLKTVFLQSNLKISRLKEGKPKVKKELLTLTK